MERNLAGFVEMGRALIEIRGERQGRGSEAKRLCPSGVTTPGRPTWPSAGMG